MTEDTEALSVVQPEQAGTKLKPAMTLPNMWQVWVRMKGITLKNTLKQYDLCGNALCEFFRDRELNPENLIQYQLHLQDRKRRDGKPIGGIWINRYIELAKGFLKWLHGVGYLKVDLSGCLNKVLVSYKPADTLIITEDEYNMIKLWAAGKDNYQTHLWLSILAYRTGMSLIDACYLRWKDVELNTNGVSIIKLYRTKNKRWGQGALCRIPIMPFTDVHQWLLNLKATQHLNYPRFDGINDYVHQDAPGLYEWENSRIQQGFQMLFKQAGVGQGKSFKHFRNAFCSNLVNSGASVALICQMTGHKNVKTLLGYLKPDDKALLDSLTKAFNYATDESKNAPGTNALTIMNKA